MRSWAGRCRGGGESGGAWREGEAVGAVMMVVVISHPWEGDLLRLRQYDLVWVRRETF